MLSRVQKESRCIQAPLAFTVVENHHANFTGSGKSVVGIRRERSWLGTDPLRKFLFFEFVKIY